MVTQLIPPDFSRQGWTDQAAGSPFLVPPGTQVTRSLAVNPATRAAIVATQPLANVSSLTVSGAATGLIYYVTGTTPQNGFQLVPVLPSLDDHLFVTCTASPAGGVLVSVVLAEQDIPYVAGGVPTSGQALGQSVNTVAGVWQSTYATLTPRDTSLHQLFDNAPLGDVGVKQRVIYVNITTDQPMDLTVGTTGTTGMILNSGGPAFLALAVVPLSNASLSNIITQQGAFTYNGNPVTLVAGVLSWFNDPLESLRVYAQAHAAAPTTGAIEMLYHRLT